jgi:SAM-dependent methyltransferase
MQGLLDRVLAPVGDLVVEAGFPGADACVLDVGCGAGATTLAMAARLGPQGGCIGVDISEPLVAAARAGGNEQASFIAADAQTHGFEPEAFDAVISRFGVMFFEDPVAAFRNIRSAVRPGGRLAFAAWRSPADNPFMTLATRAAAHLLPDLPRPEPDAPGQFGFARAERIREVLSASGWTDIEVRPLDVETQMSEPDLHRYVTTMGPVGLALQALPDTQAAAVRDAVISAYQPLLQDGVARFEMAIWLVTARA